MKSYATEILATLWRALSCCARVALAQLHDTSLHQFLNVGHDFRLLQVSLCCRLVVLEVIKHLWYKMLRLNNSSWGMKEVCSGICLKN